MFGFFCNFIFAKDGRIDFEYDLPNFDFGEARIIDTAQFSKASNFSKLKIYNYTSNKNISFAVYVHSPASNSWQDLGKIELKGFGDEVSIGQKYKGLGKHRYFALQESDKKSSNSYAYQIEKSLVSLLIYVRNIDDDLNKNPAPKHDVENAFTFSKLDLPDDAEENIVIKNASMDSIVSLKIFGWNKKTYSWEFIGAASSSTGTKSKIDLDDIGKEVEDWDYFAIVPGNSKRYNYYFSEASEDLIITVMD